jgi:DNA-binding CsgD family transcriptional regulator
MSPPGAGAADPSGRAADDGWCRSVSDFFADGLRRGEPCIAIATEREWRSVAARLAAAGVDVEHARSSGDLLFVDAESLLSSLLVDGLPDQGRFLTHVGGAIEAALQRREAHLARVYSSGVALLCARDQAVAAIHLERMFYALGRTHAFSLLCAHAMAARGAVLKALAADAGSAPASAAEPPATGTRVERVITEREEDVLRRTAHGHANKDIAQALHISVRTVEAHKANAMRKLGLTERADVIRFALAQGWLTARRGASG